MHVSCASALASFALTAALCTAASAQERLWLQQLGTSQTDSAWAIANDGADGVLLAGMTMGELGGKPQGRADVWLSKHDAHGQQLWLKQFGSSGDDWPQAMASDGTGGAFLSGYTSGDLANKNQGSQDSWLARYDTAGTQLWMVQWGTTGEDWAVALAPDGAGGVFVAGDTRGDLKGRNAGSSDVWLARYDGAGLQTWLIQFGTAKRDRAWTLAPDGAGGVFIGGHTQGELGGKPGGDFDAWLGRFDANGHKLWITQRGGASGDYAHALATDGKGGVYVAGNTDGDMGGANLGADDAWVARYDSGGNKTWAVQFGTSGHERVWALAPDGAGGVFIGGDTAFVLIARGDGTAIGGDEKAGSLGGQNQGSRDAWIAHLAADGMRDWTTQLGTTGGDEARTLAVGPSGGVFAAGQTAGGLAGESKGGVDAWVAHYAAPSK